MSAAGPDYVENKVDEMIETNLKLEQMINYPVGK